MNEFACWECGSHLQEDEVLWADRNGALNTTVLFDTLPWCGWCLPAQ